MDIKLHYVEQGSGEPLILLHGNGEDGGYFASQMDFFSGRFRVIAVDTRGHGLSPRGRGPFTLDRFADDLKSFLDGASIPRASLLGFSDGGNIALIFALKYPEYVDKLVLNGANLRPSGMRPRVHLEILRAYLSSLNPPPSDSAAVRRKELLGLMVREPHITRRELRSLDIPALVIAGTDDMIRRRHTRAISKYIRGSRLCFLEGTHFIARDSSDAFNRRVMLFLESGE